MAIDKIWLLQYRSCDKEDSKYLSSLSKNRMLCSKTFNDPESLREFSELPNGSIFLLFRDFDSWIIGFIIGDAIYSTRHPENIKRKFIPIIERKISRLPNDIFRYSFISFSENLKTLPENLVDDFENEILIHCFRCSFAELINLTQEAFREYMARKKKRTVFNWDPSLGSDKSRGIQPTREQLKRRNDAMAFGRRMPGSGFSKQ